MNLKIGQAREFGTTEVAFVFFDAGVRHGVLWQLASAGERFVANDANTEKQKFCFKFSRLERDVMSWHQTEIQSTHYGFSPLCVEGAIGDELEF